MTEDEAEGWFIGHFGRDIAHSVRSFLAKVVAENASQNLIAPSTVEEIWARHAVDSAQLVTFGRPGLWVDIGTGGGFPGLIVALVRPEPIILVEPRRKRAEFLVRCSAKLGLTHVRVATAKIEGLYLKADTISARAVASVENLLRIASGCAKEDTRWLLPRGRFSETDLAALKRDWRGVFHVEHSLTNPESSILVLDGVSRR